MVRSKEAAKMIEVSTGLFIGERLSIKRFHWIVSGVGDLRQGLHRGIQVHRRPWDGGGRSFDKQDPDMPNKL